MSNTPEGDYFSAHGAVEAGLRNKPRNGLSRSLCSSQTGWRGSGWRRNPGAGQKPAVVWDLAVIAGPGLGFSKQGETDEPSQCEVAVLVEVEFDAVEAAIARVDNVAFPEVGPDWLGVRDQL